MAWTLKRRKITAQNPRRRQFNPKTKHVSAVIRVSRAPGKRGHPAALPAHIPKVEAIQHIGIESLVMSSLVTTECLHKTSSRAAMLAALEGCIEGERSASEYYK